MKPRRTDISTEQQTSTVYRVSIGLLAVSLGLTSLALGTALFVSPGASFLFVPGTVHEASVASTATAVTLTWTAPGDDGNVGQAASYDIRYSTTPITDVNFASATPAAGAPTPSMAGTTESFDITGLQPATTYFFALKTSDAAGNVSALSNVATKTTTTVVAACLPVYTCSAWTVCTDGQTNRTCSSTNGCPSGLDQPVTTQSCTMPVVPAPDPGTPVTGGTAGIGGEPVQVINNVIVAGLAPGNLPLVRVIDPTKKKVTKEILAFDKKDRNGVNVASGDITGDHVADVIAGTGAGTNPLVKVFTTGGKLVASFNPYPTESKTGVAVATGDVDGDGIDELLTIPAKSSAQLRVWKYSTTTKKFTQLAQLFVYDRTSRQGFTVAAGDLDSDGRAEMVVTARANARSVSIVKFGTDNKLSVLRRFTPYPIQFTSGMTLTVGDIFGTGRASIVVVGGPNYYSDIKIFDINGKQQAHFLPTSTAYRNGVSLTALDLNRDGLVEIITGTYQKGAPNLFVFRYNALKKAFVRIQNYSVYPLTVTNGLRLGST